MDDKKLKKVIDKFFCWVYYPTRKGKGVFLGAGISTMKDNLAFCFFKLEGVTL